MMKYFFHSNPTLSKNNSKRLGRKLGSLSVIFLLLSQASLANASPITISTPNGAKVSIKATYKGGGTVEAVTKDNGPGDENKKPGTFTFTPPSQKDVQRIEIRSLGAVGGVLDQAAINIIDFTVAGLGDFEPIDVPTFFSATPNTILLTYINVPTFVQESYPFQVGESINISNGLFPGSNAIKFYDSSSSFEGVPQDDFFNLEFVNFNPDDLNKLPNYTGDAIVSFPAKIRSVSEPNSAFGFLLIGSFGLALILKDKMKANQML